MTEAGKQKIRRRRRFYSWTGALLVAGTLLVANYIVSFFPLRVDTTEAGIYSLSDGSKALLDELDDTLLIRMVFSEGLPPQFKLNEQYIRDLLSEYKKAGDGKVRLDFLDPGASEGARQEAMSLGVSPVQLDVRERDRREVKEGFMGIAFLYEGRTEAIAFIQSTQGLEYEISQRIKRLIDPDLPTIAIADIAGSLTFGNPALSRLKPVLEQLFQLEHISLDEPVPADARALWLIGPTEPIDDEQKAALRSWVEAGGTLGLLIDRFSVQVDQFRTERLDVGINDLLSEWGVELGDGLVGDLRSDRIQVQTSRGFFQVVNLVDYAYFPLSTNLNREHPATKNIGAVSFPFVAPVSIVQEKEGLSYVALAQSSEYSWVNDKPAVLSPLEGHRKPEGAESGPFNLALLVEGRFGDGADAAVGRVIIVGTSRFARTDYPTREENYRFFMNLLDWSAQEESLLSIRGKGISLRPLKRLGNGARIAVKYGMVGALPLLALLAGLIIWRREKVRRSRLPRLYQGN